MKRFTVDTVPPVPYVELLSLTPTKNSTALFKVGCWDALTVENCSVTYSGRVYPAGGLSPYDLEPTTLWPWDLDANHSAVVNVSVQLENGALELTVTAIDGAGNAVSPARGRPATSPRWIRDTQSPDTSSTLTSSEQLVFVGGYLNASVTNASSVALTLTSSEGVQGYRVTVTLTVSGVVNRSVVAPALGTSHILQLTELPDAVLTIAVVRHPSPAAPAPLAHPTTPTHLPSPIPLEPSTADRWQTVIRMLFRFLYPHVLAVVCLGGHRCCWQ